MELSFSTAVNLVLIILVPYIGYLHKNILDMKTRLETKMNQDDVLELINLKKEVTDFQYQTLRDDIEEIKIKLDRLIDSIQKI